jgi:hypothetical protein
MAYNLTDDQKKLIQWLVEETRKENLNKEFQMVDAGINLMGITDDYHKGEYNDWISKTDVKILCEQGFLKNYSGSMYNLPQVAFDAVDAKFGAPDTSFLKYVTPLDLEAITNLDQEIKDRCLSALVSDGSNPKNWDSAIRTAGVVLEERLRKLGEQNSSDTSDTLVTNLFKQNGVLANKFTDNREREAYLKLYLGAVGVFRNPSAHRFIDPDPYKGGVQILFIDLLLKKLKELS